MISYNTFSRHNEFPDSTALSFHSASVLRTDPLKARDGDCVTMTASWGKDTVFVCLSYLNHQVILPRTLLTFLLPETHHMSTAISFVSKRNGTTKMYLTQLLLASGQREEKEIWTFHSSLGQQFPTFFISWHK